MCSNGTAKTRRTVLKFNQSFSLIIALCLTASMAWADSLELKNGSLINGKFMGGTESAISFQVGSEVRSYNLADITSLKFDSGTSDGGRARRIRLPAKLGSPRKRPRMSRSRQERGSRSVPSTASIPPRTMWAIVLRRPWKNPLQSTEM